MKIARIYDNYHYCFCTLVISLTFFIGLICFSPSCHFSFAEEKPRIVDLTQILIPSNFSGSVNLSNVHLDSINNVKGLFDSRERNISTYENIDLGSVDYSNTDYQDHNFANSLNKLLLIDINDDSKDVLLLQINGSNLQEYSEDKLSGNGILTLDGFKFDEQYAKIFAYGTYHSLIGNQYDVKFGLAPKYHNHSIFVIDPVTTKIVDIIKLWEAEDDGDETTIGDVYINNDTKKLYATALDEGELDDIYVIDVNTSSIETVIPTYDKFKKHFDGKSFYDSGTNILYLCSDDGSIIGLDMSRKGVIVKNISSSYCPTVIDSKAQKGYTVDYEDYDINSNPLVAVINLTSGEPINLIIGGNLSDIIIDNSLTSNYSNQNSMLLVGHSINIFENACTSDNKAPVPPDSFIIQLNVTSGDVTAVNKFKNVFIDKIYGNPITGHLYALTNEILSDPYSCYNNQKLYYLKDISTTIG